MTLLTIIQDVTDELSLPRPSSIINNTNTTTRQLLSIANGSGKRMMKRYDFQELLTEFTHTTLAAEDQGAILTVVGNDYDRLSSLTLWNRDKTRPLLGPYTAQEWQRDKGSITTTIFEAFRLRGGRFLIIPAPAAGEIVAGEFISENWILDVDGTTRKAKFAKDNDTPLIEEDLFVLDIKWRWLRSHGFDYAEEKTEFEIEFSDVTGADKSSRIIDLATVTQGVFRPDRFNTPDGGFGQ